MASCGYCGTWILFSGVRDGDLRYCNNQCQELGLQTQLAERLPEEMLEQAIANVHLGACPICNGPGPVDVHKSYRVLSLLAFTSWSSRVKVGCLSCGRKAKVVDTFYCLFLGWWGVPWGFIMTPIQLGRNLIGVCQGNSPQPSEVLRKIVSLDLAANVLESNRQARALEAKRAGPGASPR